MGLSLLLIPLLFALALPEDPQSQAGMPWMTSVDPTSGKIGDVLNIEGVNLGQNNVAALYLTDGKTDVKAVIIAQTDTSIRFRIPPEAKPGRLALMVLTRGQNPKLIEEPVKITVEPAITSPTISSSGDEPIDRIR